MGERVPMPGGGFAIVCGGRHRKPTPCAYCSNPGEKLCDGPLPAGMVHWTTSRGGETTCSRPVCRIHAIHVHPDLDFCREPACRAAASAAAAQQRLALEDR